MSKRVPYFPPIPEMGFRVEHLLPKRTTMKKKQLQALIAAMDEKLAKTMTEVADLRTRLDFQIGVVEQLMAANARHETLGQKIKDLHKETKTIGMAMGGAIWKTQHGHMRFISLLSTGHLCGIQDLGLADDYVNKCVVEELERRQIDSEYREEQVRMDKGLRAKYPERRKEMQRWKDNNKALARRVGK